MFYGSYFSENVEFTDEFIEYGYSPNSLNFVSKKGFEMLKEIQTDFETTKSWNETAVQLIIDENFFNAFISSFTTVDKMYSLREFMSEDTRLSLFKQLLTTTTLGLGLPSFKEDYGEGKSIDLVGTLSHDYISEKIPDAAKSGLQLDKNGNLKLSLNGGA